MGELEEFTEFLYGNETGFVYAPIKKKDSSWHQEWFHWPLDKHKLHDWIRTNAIESDVYIAPAIFGEKKLSKSNVKNSNVVWIEVDGKSDFTLKGIELPSYRIQSSTEHNQHLYWKIEEGQPDAIEDVNRRLTYFLEADSSGWDITQVLRPPETINHKPGKDLPVKVISKNATVYSLKDFDAAPSIPTFESLTIDSIPNCDAVLARYKLPRELLDRITKETPVVYGPEGRSGFLMSTGYLLAEAGLRHEEIVSLIFLMDGRIRKFIGRADAVDRISQLASIAVLKIQSRHQIEFYTLNEILTSDRTLEWYIPGILPKKGFMFLTAPPSTGKSLLLSDMVHALTTGNSFLEYESCEPLDCILFQIEMFFEEQKYFWEIQAKGWDKQELMTTHGKTFFDKIVDEPFLEAIIKEFKPHVVFIDSLTDLVRDSAEEEARRITSFLMRMREEYGTSFVIIHHNRKHDNTSAVRKPKSLSDLYGSYILARSCQTVLSLWKDEKKSYYELDSLKGRFMDMTSTILLNRDENLNYSRIHSEINTNVSDDVRAAAKLAPQLDQFS